MLVQRSFLAIPGNIHCVGDTNDPAGGEEPVGIWLIRTRYRPEMFFTMFVLDSSTLDLLFSYESIGETSLQFWPMQCNGRHQSRLLIQSKPIEKLEIFKELVNF